MKPASKKFWPCASVVAAALLVIPLVATGASKRAAEKSLAGLRPGKDSLQSAYRRFKERYKDPLQSDLPRYAVWRDACNHQQLLVAMDDNGIVKAVVVEHELGSIENICTQKSYSRRVRARFGSGRGLLYGDHCERIQELHGTPGSKASTTEDGKQLESYAYTFESNSKSALRLEVSCDSSSDSVSKLRLETVGASAQ